MRQRPAAPRHAFPALPWGEVLVASAFLMLIFSGL